MAELARRTTIDGMRRVVNSVSDIIKSTDFAKSTVYRVVATFDAEVKVQRSRHSENQNEREPKHSLLCLLYTSPSPRDKRQSRMPSSA